MVKPVAASLAARAEYNKNGSGGNCKNYEVTCSYYLCALQLLGLMDWTMI